jgi:hypothetical protein
MLLRIATPSSNPSVEPPDSAVGGQSRVSRTHYTLEFVLISHGTDYKDGVLRRAQESGEPEQKYSNLPLLN